LAKKESSKAEEFLGKAAGNRALEQALEHFIF
jgi:hypothetical protein